MALKLHVVVSGYNVLYEEPAARGNVLIQWPGCTVDFIFTPTPHFHQRTPPRLMELDGSLAIGSGCTGRRERQCKPIVYIKHYKTKGKQWPVSIKGILPTMCLQRTCNPSAIVNESVLYLLLIYFLIIIMYLYIIL